MILEFFKKHYVKILLVLILIIGFYVRIYHIDYPVIGYHNMKEAHTLGEAWFMYTDGDYSVNKEIYRVTETNPEGVHMDNFPLLVWIIVLLWKIFGAYLWIARLVIILFSLGTIYMTYLITKKLFEWEDLALLSAFFVSICPLLIFFGRNVQYDVPTLFFMLSSIYFFLKWRENNTMKNIILFSSFIVLTSFMKLPFLIILIPILSIFNFKKIKFEQNYKQYMIAITLFSLIIAFIIYSNYIDVTYNNPPGIQAFATENLHLLLTANFWKTIYTYAVTDNFTTFGTILALIGVILVTLKFKEWNYRFLSVWFFSYIIYAAFSPAQMTGHSYYQIPYAPLMMILIAYTFLFIFNIAATFIKEKHIKVVVIYVGILVVLFAWYPALSLSTTRQFDTQFFGLDVAGDFINANSQPNEIIFESGHQDRGIAWHSKRRLTEFNNVSDFNKEVYKDINWIFLYNWGLEKMKNPQFNEYISNSYSLAQVGFIRVQNSNQLYYFLFKRGGSFNESMMNELLYNKEINNKIYKLTNNREILFNYINV